MHRYLVTHLVLAVAPVPVGLAPAGDLVDEDDLVVVHAVLLVAVESVAGVTGPLDSFVELVRGMRVRAAEQVGAAEILPASVGQVELSSVSQPAMRAHQEVGWLAD